MEAKTGILRRFAECFSDHRDPERIEHSVYELLAQRVYALALGYEDLNDHDALRHDPLLAVLAGKSTLNRLELTPTGADEKSRYKKIVARHRDIEPFFVETFLALHRQPPEEIVLDFDATDDPIHGHQLGRIIVRGDSGFCRENLMAWCEANGVDFVLGLAKNARLQRILGRELHEAKVQFDATGQASRVFKDFTYQTRKSWSRERRVAGFRCRKVARISGCLPRRSRTCDGGRCRCPTPDNGFAPPKAEVSRRPWRGRSAPR